MWACGDAGTQLVFDPDPSDSTAVVPRGQRVLGISISDRADGDFNDAFEEARAAGMQATSLSLAWDDLEVAPGVYDPEIDFLDIAAGYYPARETRLLLAINPIDTNNRRVPEYLDGLEWDDPAVVQAFEDLLDWALPRAMEVDLVALAVGNEIDATLASQEEWESYRAFLAQVSEHADSLRPGLRIGAKITAEGLTGAFADEAALVTEASGLVLTTFYPLGPGFQIEDPSMVDGVFDDLVDRFPDLPILFAEIGSPSTSLCGSSEALQAEFVGGTFAAWDRHADRVEYLEFVWMHDISQDALEVYEEYYGVSDECFLEYLGTLGLQSFAGVDKPAWSRLVGEADARGW